MQQYKQLLFSMHRRDFVSPSPPIKDYIKDIFSRASQQAKCVFYPICMSCCPIKLEFNKLGIC